MQKPFNPIRDDPPEIVEVNGREYPIKQDFRTVFDYFELMSGDDSENDKTKFGLALFYGNEVYKEDLQGLAEKLSWFIDKGKDRDPEEQLDKTRTFDLLVDSGKIYAAFMQVYHINLRKVKMHWWIFLELFEGLPAGTHLANVIELRGKQIDKNMSDADKNALVKAQDYYRIGEKSDPMQNLFGIIRSL